MNTKTFFYNLAENISLELEKKENRYFTYHIPKNFDINREEVIIYFHEPILNNMTFYLDYPKGRRFGYMIKVFKDVDENNEELYAVSIGFSIVHSKRLAYMLSNNFKEPSLQNEMINLIKYLEKKGLLYTQISNEKNKIIEITEKNIKNIPKFYPAKDGMFKGSYFDISYSPYEYYFQLEDILIDTKIIARDLIYYFSFLYKALFPKKDKKYRDTDQFRLLNSWFKNNNIPKQCEIIGCNEKKELEIHHIIPHSKGGKDNIKNLICLCKKHHQEAHKSKSYIKGNIFYMGENKYSIKDFAYKRINNK